MATINKNFTAPSCPDPQDLQPKKSSLSVYHDGSAAVNLESRSGHRSELSGQLSGLDPQKNQLQFTTWNSFQGQAGVLIFQVQPAEMAALMAQFPQLIPKNFK